MKVPWLLQGRSFPACAEGGGTALRGGRAAHAGQDDSAVRWAGSVENRKKLHLQSNIVMTAKPLRYTAPYSITTGNLAGTHNHWDSLQDQLNV